jgi:hypothetical protein
MYVKYVIIVTRLISGLPDPDRNRFRERRQDDLIVITSSLYHRGDPYQ